MTREQKSSFSLPNYERLPEVDLSVSISSYRPTHLQYLVGWSRRFVAGQTACFGRVIRPKSRVPCLGLLGGGLCLGTGQVEFGVDRR